MNKYCISGHFLLKMTYTTTNSSKQRNIFASERQLKHKKTHWQGKEHWQLLIACFAKRFPIKESLWILENSERKFFWFKSIFTWDKDWKELRYSQRCCFVDISWKSLWILLWGISNSFKHPKSPPGCMSWTVFNRCHVRASMMEKDQDVRTWKGQRVEGFI